mmetsp:Transcript_20135/g.61249  ORF Transcript_20135/g.61249 Transcript_20135/m.61249 type:complete len:332 (+) Transcript_20135:2460-3455(+)|eukprot:scaffold53920_cov31-Tisochrysis_lutea.AAC.2
MLSCMSRTSRSRSGFSSCARRSISWSVACASSACAFASSDSASKRSSSASRSTAERTSGEGFLCCGLALASASSPLSWSLSLRNSVSFAVASARVCCSCARMVLAASWSAVTSSAAKSSIYCSTLLGASSVRAADEVMEETGVWRLRAFGRGGFSSSPAATLGSVLIHKKESARPGNCSRRAGCAGDAGSSSSTIAAAGAGARPSSMDTLSLSSPSSGLPASCTFPSDPTVLSSPPSGSSVESSDMEERARDSIGGRTIADGGDADRVSSTYHGGSSSTAPVARSMRSCCSISWEGLEMIRGVAGFGFCTWAGRVRPEPSTTSLSVACSTP